MSVPTIVRVKGIKELEKGLDRLLMNKLGPAVEVALQRIAEHVKKVSNSIAPERTGTLIAESFLVFEERDGFDTIVWVGYGPPGSVSNSYAYRQHEFFEQKRKPGRTWQYLRIPIRTEAGRMEKIVREIISKALKK